MGKLIKDGMADSFFCPSISSLFWTTDLSMILAAFRSMSDGIASSFPCDPGRD